MSEKAVSVVIADDEPMMRKLIASIIGAAGFDLVGTAEDGAEAIDLCNELKPDVLLLDLHMPGMSGIKALKQLSGENHMPCVIMLTAEHQSDIVEDCFRHGAKNCAHKDTNITELPAIIRTSLNP